MVAVEVDWVLDALQIQQVNGSGLHILLYNDPRAKHASPITVFFLSGSIRPWRSAN